MVNSNHGVHHVHKRKRIHLKHEKYPHPNKTKFWMDKFAYFAAIISPIMTLPQIYKIYFEKNAFGISIISWSTYLLTTIFWFFYGILHKEKPIIFTNFLWIILDILIIVGTVIYG